MQIPKASQGRQRTEIVRTLSDGFDTAMDEVMVQRLATIRTRTSRSSPSFVMRRNLNCLSRPRNGSRAFGGT